MKVLIIAYGTDLTQAMREAQDVLNILQAGGCSVHLLANQDVTLDCLGEVLDHGPFDMVWLIVHSGSDGFALADQVISAAQLGQWLDATRCRQVVLNSCFSAEHVDVIQRAATRGHRGHHRSKWGQGPSGALDRGVSGAGVCRDTGDLEEACSRASGNGLVQYRWFPAGDKLRSDGRRMALSRQVERQQDGGAVDVAAACGARRCRERLCRSRGARQRHPDAAAHVYRRAAYLAHGDRAPSGHFYGRGAYLACGDRAPPGGAGGVTYSGSCRVVSA